MKTYSTKPADIERKWHVIDASGKVLGKVATEVAGLLMGKHKPYFSPHLDTGDYVVVINAEKVQVTGNKAKKKLYYRHTGYPGGLKSVNLEKMMEQHPTRALEHAVKGMLPHTRLGNSMFKKLKVYAGDDLLIPPRREAPSAKRDTGRTEGGFYWRSRLIFTEQAGASPRWRR